MDCKKNNLWNAIHQVDPMQGGWGGRFRPHNSGGGGAPLSTDFTTTVLFVLERYFVLLGLWDLQNQA